MFHLNFIAARVVRRYPPFSMSANEPPGLLAALRGVLAGAVALLENRLSLLAVELREAKLRLLALLLASLGALILLLAGVVFLAIFLTVLFWDSHRLLVLGIFAALFLAGGFLALVAVRRLLAESGRMFGDTLAELAADRSALEAMMRGERKAPPDVAAGADRRL